MTTVRFASVRGFSVAAATLVLALPGIRAARGAETAPMLVATPDPALLSALDAAFSPRGVRVAMADRSLRATGDDLGAGTRGADLVWLCDVTPAPAGPPSPSGGAAPATALCVRPHQGTVIIRRIAVATPLSPEDAAALALSVQVALMSDGAPPPAIARPAPIPAAARAADADAGGAPRLTFELASGVHGGPYGSYFRLGAAGTFMPAWLGRRFGIGFAVAGGSASDRSTAIGAPGRGPQFAPQLVQSNGASEIAFRPFVRGQAGVGPLWLQLDLGPEVHGLARGAAPSFLFGENERWYWSLDGFLGAVIPFGRLFAGARVGVSEQMSGRGGEGPIGDPWNGEALVVVGAGRF
jgi:hypothetical protein